MALNPNNPLDQAPIIHSPEVSGGQYSDIDPASIPNNALSYTKNVVVRDGKTTRRPGTGLFTPVAPNGVAVINITDYQNASGTNRIVRHTKSSVHYATAGAWQNVAGALVGTDSDLIRSVIMGDRYFFVNNGLNVIQEINFIGNTFAQASATAPKVKRLFGFNRRLIGLNVKAGPAPYTVDAPTLIVWSGDLNFTQFDYITDISAGFKLIVESQSDTTDFIVDGVDFDNIAIIVRQKSIWMMIPQNIATDPFYIFPKVPNVGCGCDFGVVKVDQGLAFPDLRTKRVISCLIDGSFEDLSTGKVKRSLFPSIVDPTKVFSDFNPTEGEFSIWIPGTGGITKCWTFNYLYKAWTYNEYDSITIATAVANASSSRTIAELPGTIADLPGLISGLSDPILGLAKRLLGRSNGDILSVNDTGSTDNTLGNLASAYPTEWRFKTVNITIENLDGGPVFINIYPYTTGTINLDYSRDDGTTWITKKSFPINNWDLNKPGLLILRDLFNASRLTFRLTSNDVRFDLLDYAVLGTVGGTKI